MLRKRGWTLEKFSFTHLADELLRRKVVRVALGYSIIVWLLLQIAEVTFEPLHLPGWSMTLLVVSAMAGFPVAVILAWAFEVTPEGLQRDPQDLARENADDSAAPANRGDYRTVAVLPFADMSPARDQGYFCEGIAEEILSSLSAVKCLHVPSRTSSFRFNAEDHDICETGKSLGVETVLEGSLRKEGDRIRITAQLINVADGFHIWASTYDRNLTDVLDLQQELSRDIVRQLCESLPPDETILREPAAAADIRAYDYYLQGQFFMNRFSRRGAEFAIRMFRRAVELDSDFSLAWSGMAQAHTYLCVYHENTKEHREQARESAARAMELLPGSAPSRTAQGMALMLVGRYAEAEIEFAQALVINPMQFSASYYYARCCQFQGKLQQAVELFERASRRRPEDYQAPLLALSIYRAQGNKKMARNAAQRGVAAAELHLLLHPDDARALYLGSLALLELGETDKARAWIERALELNPSDGLVRYNAACFYAQARDLERARTNLSHARKSGLAFGDWIKTDPDLAPLRADPDFTNLAQNQ
ncbi:MAG: hypothetical protein OEQ74_10235 [Gammaproteobacteria bacterium]|nr:hypothetical protein [Gammaproteobacteria bacterium]